MTELLAHSPLGASGAERWMPEPYGGGCSGSVSLSVGITDDDDDDEFSGSGKAAHALAAYCLESGDAAWMMMGWAIAEREGEMFWFPDEAPHEHPADAIVVDKEMADAVQVYLDAIRQAYPDQNQGNTWVERQFHCPDIHELFYGTSDFVHLSYEDTGVIEPGHVEQWCQLDVWDFKYGAGIVVEVKENPQLMYYACGMLESLGLWNTINRITLHIAQPRGFHFDGPLRKWSISLVDLQNWMLEILIPAMTDALVSTDMASGEHCRFCPVRGRACPQLMQDLDELEARVQIMNEVGGAAKLTAKQLGRILDLMVPAMIARKQALKNATGMLNAGHKVPGWKLAKARSNRKFKDGAADAAWRKFKELALTKPELKSPAQIDKLPEGDAFTARWAFKPDTGETVVPEGDSRMAVSKDTKALFSPVKKERKK